MRTPTDTSSLTDLVLGKLSPEEARRVLGRIEQDPELSHELDELIALREFVQTSGRDMFVRDSAARSYPRPWAVICRPLDRLLRPVPARLGLAGIIVCSMAAGILLYSSSTPVARYGEGVRVRVHELIPVVRGVEEDELGRILELVEVNDLDGAGLMLDRFLRSHPRSSAAPYARLLRGGICLAQAPWGVGGVPLGVDQTAAREGLLHLDVVVAYGTSGALEEEARWCRARGYLLAGKEVEAREDLRWVEDHGGDRCEGARQLLREVEWEGGDSSWSE